MITSTGQRSADSHDDAVRFTLRPDIDDISDRAGGHSRGLEMSAPSPSPAPLHGTEKAVLDEFSARRTRLNDTHNKITELSADIAEHDLVLKTLAGMSDPDKRKCHRLVGGVLVERTVAEVAPAVKKNRYVCPRKA